MGAIAVTLLSGSLLCIVASMRTRYALRDKKMGWLWLLAAIVLSLAGTAVNSFSSEGWGFNYVCSNETSDVYHLETDSETWWTLVPQRSNQQVSTNSSGYYTFEKGGVYVWVGLAPLGLADVGESDCEDGLVTQPYTNPMNECLGFYAPVSDFVVDGLVYQAGEDGWISFLVPKEAVWVWAVTVDGWTGYYAQTETEACHYVD